MNEVVEYGGSNGFGKRLQTIDQNVQFRPVYDQGPGIPESMRPISIQINVNRDEGSSKEKRPFSLMRSKLVWLLMTLLVSFGLSYARTRTVCQGFKDTGKFYYGMDVNRCIGILIKEPLANVDSQLSKLNINY